MAASNFKFNFENTRDNLNQFYEAQLAELKLDKHLLQEQTLPELRQSLTIINQAIDHHESFGKFSLKMSAQMAIVVSSSSESLFSIGILPLLLERKQIILERIEYLKDLESDTLAENAAAKARMLIEIDSIAHSEVNRRLWLVIIVLVVIWIGLVLLIQRFGWDDLEPWTYLFGFAVIIIGYIYLAIKKKEFSPSTIYIDAVTNRTNHYMEVFEIDT